MYNTTKVYLTSPGPSKNWNNSFIFCPISKTNIPLESTHICVQDVLVDAWIISIAKLAVCPIKKVYCAIDRKECTARNARYRYAPI